MLENLAKLRVKAHSRTSKPCTGFIDVFNSLLLRKGLRGLDVMGEEEEGISASLNRPEVMLDCMLPDILLDMLDWAPDGVRV